MNKLLNTLALGCLLTLASTTAGAITITDVNVYGTGTGALSIANGSSFTDTWSLLPYGYRPGIDTISSATAAFTLFDTNSSNFYSISIDGSAFTGGSNFKGIFISGGNIIGSVLGNLSDTGLLSYTITNTSNANPGANGPLFRLESASLTATLRPAGPAPAGVPESGGSAALLGLSVLGLIGARQLRS